MYKIGLAEIKLIHVVSSIMNKFLSFAKQALYFAGRAVAAGVLPAIATYYWTLNNHDNYWNRTIFAVQTVDFKILSHTLPTKLSTLILKNDREEIQRTLKSNTGRFGMVVTDCKVADKECLNQTVLYKTESKSSWSRNFSIEVLRDAPFDILRDPPPLKTEIDFPDIRSSKVVETGNINSGKIIGRVYYVRGIPPSYIDSWTSYFNNPSAGVGNFYSSAIATFLLSWLLILIGLEVFYNKLKSEKQKREQLSKDLKVAKATSQNLKKRFEVDRAKIQILSEQNQRQSIDLSDKEQLLTKLEKEFEVSQIQAEEREKQLRISLENAEGNLQSQKCLVVSQQQEILKLSKGKESLEIQLNTQVAQLDKLRQDLLLKQRISIDQSVQFNKLVHQLSLKKEQKQKNQMLIESLTLQLSKAKPDNVENVGLDLSKKLNELNQAQSTLNREIEISQTELQIIQKALAEKSLDIKKLESQLEENRLQQEITNQNLIKKQRQLNDQIVTLNRERENLELSQKKAAKLNAELQNSHKKIDELSQERLNLNANIDSIRLSKQELEEDLQAIQLEKSIQEQKIQELQSEIDGRDASLRDLQNSNAKLKQELNESIESEQFDNEFELIVYQYVQSLLPIQSQKWLLLPNFDVGSYQKSLQTDFVVITQHFVAVLEVKFAQGKVIASGDPKNTQWFSNDKLIRAGSQYRKNPYIQVSSYAKSLMGLFQKHLPSHKGNVKIPFYGIVVFPNEVNLQDFPSQIGGYYYVTALSRLAQLLSELENTNYDDSPQLTVVEIEGIISGKNIVWLKNIA